MFSRGCHPEQGEGPQRSVNILCSLRGTSTGRPRPELQFPTECAPSHIPVEFSCINESMRLPRLIASGLLFTVLLSPVLGLALCASRTAAAKGHCTGHCPMHCPLRRPGAATGLPRGSAPATAPVAPCCERETPMPASTETSAQIVAPVQIALLPAATLNPRLPAAPAFRLARAAAAPALAPPFSLLCTLLI